MQIWKVFQLAADLHRGQVDKAGRPYIEHLTRVFLRVQAAGGSLDQQIAALLHDAIEDGKATAAELVEAGIPNAAVDLIEALTHRDGETYLDYITRLKTFGAVVPVKLADLDDNSDPDRLAALPEKEANRLKERYSVAVSFLKNLQGKNCEG